MDVRDKINNYSLSPQELSYQSNGREIEIEIKQAIVKNITLANNSVYVKNQVGVFSNPNFLNDFTLSGSLKISSMDMLGDSKEFFTKDGRFFEKNTVLKKEFILRGPRYIAAIDPHLSVLQKLRIYYEDVCDGIDFISNRIFNQNKKYIELSPILDYIKNALVTLYNAFTHKEKLGQLELRNPIYQSQKKELLFAVEEAVICYYLSLVNECSEDMILKLTSVLNKNHIKKIIDTIADEFKDFKFSSKAMVRPEASHPLILAAFAHNLFEKFPNVKIIFGLPAGGTELTCLVHKYWEYKSGKNTLMVLLPISLHSLKNDFGRRRKSKLSKQYSSLIPSSNLDSSSINSLLIDDNSATGGTIEVAQKFISKYNKSVRLVCLVAEADTMRTKLRFKNDKKVSKIAHPIVYAESIGILPISKLIKPKNDLKEIIESRLLQKHYLDKNQQSSLFKRIKASVIADAIENKSEYLFSSFNEENSIQAFKHTFLSNFYSVKIHFQGKSYPSVEHAYISKKFRPDVFKNLSLGQIAELNQIFKMKGIAQELTDFSNIFFDKNIPAGIVKRISNKLKGWGYKNDDWDDIRLDLMINLLWLKFSNTEMRHLLMKTKGKYLVEGNDWNDTYWGINNKTKKGENFLGRIIMKIRDIHEKDTPWKKDLLSALQKLIGGKKKEKNE